MHLSREQRVAVTYALLAQGEEKTRQEQILTRAKDYFKNAFAQSAQIIQVKNFQDFLKAFKGEWPDTQSVALDMDLLEKAGPRPLPIFKSNSPRIQGQIDRYLRWQTLQLAGLVDFTALSDKLLVHDLLPSMATLPVTGVQRGLESWLLNKSDAWIGEHLEELNHVGEKIAHSGFAEQQDASVRILMQTMLTEYFSRLSPASKKLIVSSFLGGDLQVSDIQKFSVMVQNSGPQLQKLLQIVARQSGLNKQVLEVFRALESSVREVPWLQVSEIVNSEKENFKFTYFEKEASGRGNHGAGSSR